MRIYLLMGTIVISNGMEKVYHDLDGLEINNLV